MKFNCGEPYHLRYAKKVQKKLDWHRKFAWWPVRVGQYDCRWLEFVERKGRIGASWGGVVWEYEYRPHETYYC